MFELMFIKSGVGNIRRDDAWQDLYGQALTDAKVLRVLYSDSEIYVGFVVRIVVVID